MACWDIVGKAVGKPVYELLGGRVRERLRLYTYIYPEPRATRRDVYHDRGALGRACGRTTLALGFTALKFDPAGAYSAFDPRQPSLADPRALRALRRPLREAVGTRADLLFGTHGQFTTSGAIRLARASSPMTRSGSRSRAARNAGGDGPRGARHVDPDRDRRAPDHEVRVRARARDAAPRAILQMNLGRVGGLLEAKKIAGMAECALRADRAAPLLRARSIGAANIQLAASHRRTS